MFTFIKPLEAEVGNAEEQPTRNKVVRGSRTSGLGNWPK